MPRLLCTTSFDITKTAVTGFFRQDKIPFVDESGKHIVDKPTWTVARNQNRNLETILQILSLRTQIFDVSVPLNTDGVWQFGFSVDTLSVYSDTAHNDLNVLKTDANNVPMLILNNKSGVDVAMTKVYGDDPNLFFEISVK